MDERPRDMHEQGSPPRETDAVENCGDNEPRCACDADAWRRVNLALWWAFSKTERKG